MERNPVHSASTSRLPHGYQGIGDTFVQFLGPIGPALIISDTIVAMITVHRQHGLFASDNGVEVSLVYITLALGLILTGYGRYSVDEWLGIANRWTPTTAAGLAVYDPRSDVGNTAPPYQSPWFLAAVVLTLMAAEPLLLYALLQARARRLEEQVHLRFDAALDERTRVARELHDTLLQGFGGITLQLAAVQNSLPENAVESAERLTRVLSMADETLRGARQAIWDMRAPELGEHTLADALEGAARGAIGDMPVKLAFAVRGDRRRVEPRIESTVLRIGREAIINAVHHGRPRVVEVDLLYDDHHVDLAVRDDGRGFDAADATAAVANGHWGVRGMFERAARAGGSLKIDGRVGEGTWVALSLPTSQM